MAEEYQRESLSCLTLQGIGKRLGKWTPTFIKKYEEEDTKTYRSSKRSRSCLSCLTSSADEWNKARWKLSSGSPKGVWSLRVPCKASTSSFKRVPFRWIISRRFHNSSSVSSVSLAPKKRHYSKWLKEGWLIRHTSGGGGRRHGRRSTVSFFTGRFGAEPRVLDGGRGASSRGVGSVLFFLTRNATQFFSHTDAGRPITWPNGYGNVRVM